MDKETERLRIIALFRGAITKLEAIKNYEEFKFRDASRLKGFIKSIEEEQDRWMQKN